MIYCKVKDTRTHVYLGDKLNGRVKSWIANQKVNYETSLERGTTFTETEGYTLIFGNYHLAMVRLPIMR